MGNLNDGAIIEKYAGYDFNTGAIQANVGDDYIAAMRQLDITQNCNKYNFKSRRSNYNYKFRRKRN